MPLVLDKKRHPVQIGWRELLFGTKRLKGQKGTKNKKVGTWIQKTILLLAVLAWKAI